MGEDLAEFFTAYSKHLNPNHRNKGQTKIRTRSKLKVKRSYFWLLTYSRGVITAGSCACLIWQSVLQDALPEVSPPGIELGIFHLLGKL